MLPLPWHQREFEALVGAKDRLAHALLIHGPRGIGKLDFARALAQALLCESPGDAKAACGHCTACAWFETGAHPDYRQIEPAAESEDDEAEEEEEDKPAKKGKKPSIWIIVKQIRTLPELINVTSHRGGPKVILLQPAEALNVNAANALLKSLEEPPPGTHFILVSHRAHQLLPTIKSRCRQVALRTPDRDSAAKWLASQGVKDGTLALAHTGDAPLLALALDDSGYWGARKAFLRQITAREVDVLDAAEAVRDLPVPHIVSWLQKWCCDIAFYRTLREVRYNPDEREAIARIADRVDPLAALRLYRRMTEYQLIAQHPLNAKLFIEHLLFAYRNLVQPQ
jgi:DNA polymerase III subunit delta'